MFLLLHKPTNTSFIFVLQKRMQTVVIYCITNSISNSTATLRTFMAGRHECGTRHISTTINFLLPNILIQLIIYEFHIISLGAKKNTFLIHYYTTHPETTSFYAVKCFWEEDERREKKVKWRKQQNGNWWKQLRATWNDGKSLRKENLFFTRKLFLFRKFCEVNDYTWRRAKAFSSKNWARAAVNAYEYFFFCSAVYTYVRRPEP